MNPASQQVNLCHHHVSLLLTMCGAHRGPSIVSFLVLVSNECIHATWHHINMIPEKHSVPTKQPWLKLVAGPVLSPSEQHVQAVLIAGQEWFVSTSLDLVTLFFRVCDRIWKCRGTRGDISVSADNEVLLALLACWPLESWENLRGAWNESQHLQFWDWLTAAFWLRSLVGDSPRWISSNLRVLRETMRLTGGLVYWQLHKHCIRPIRWVGNKGLSWILQFTSGCIFEPLSRVIGVGYWSKERNAPLPNWIPSDR